MLYLNVSDEDLEKWRNSIEYYNSLHLANIYNDLNSVNLSIKENPSNLARGKLYHCRLLIEPKTGQSLDIVVECEDCAIAIDQCFAKAKRYLVRRKRGFNLSVSSFPKLRGRALDHS